MRVIINMKQPLSSLSMKTMRVATPEQKAAIEKQAKAQQAKLVGIINDAVERLNKKGITASASTKFSSNAFRGLTVSGTMKAKKDTMSVSIPFQLEVKRGGTLKDAKFSYNSRIVNTKLNEERKLGMAVTKMSDSGIVTATTLANALVDYFDKAATRKPKPKTEDQKRADRYKEATDKVTKDIQARMKIAQALAKEFGNQATAIRHSMGGFGVAAIVSTGKLNWKLDKEGKTWTATLCVGPMLSDGTSSPEFLSKKVKFSATTPTALMAKLKSYKK